MPFSTSHKWTINWEKTVNELHDESEKEANNNKIMLNIT